MRGIIIAVCTLIVLSMFPAVHLEHSARAQSAGDTICSAENGDACYNTSAGPIFTLPQWADANDWSEARYYSTIQLADIDGDGADELLARGPDGIIVQKWDAASGHAVWNQITGSGPFSDSDGWGSSEYFVTIQTADIDGDGAVELLGRGKNGLDTYSWNGTGWDLLKSDDPAWTNEGDWDKPEYYETIQTADIDGDNTAELLARDSKGLNTYRWNDSGWIQIGTERPAWNDDVGWNLPQYYQTIQTGDIDGDGAEELIARGAAGIESYDWDGSSWNLIKVGSPSWTDKADWDQPQYYRTIQTADVNGDKRDELIGRTAVGIDTYEWNGSGWQLLQKAVPDWKDTTGWSLPEYYRTIQTGDIDGDQAAELIARSSSGIDTYQWLDGGWSQVGSSNPALSDDNWETADNYLTIQTGDANGDGGADLVARGLYGIRTWSWNEVTANAWDNPVSYGLPAFTGDQLAAYEYTGTFLTIDSNQTVRDQYTTDPTTLGEYKDCLLTGSNDNAWNDWTEIPTETCLTLHGSQTPITPPSGLTLENWNTVAEQIFNELAQAESVSTYFSDLTTLYTDIYNDDQSILISTAHTLFGEDMSKQKVDAFWQNLFLAPFKLAPLGGPVSSAVGATAAALISGGLNLTNSDSFEGTWADVQNQYNTLRQQNEDAISSSHAFVAGDATLLSYVALQKSSGAWNPADDWVKRYITSTGRKQFSLWITQTLAPSVWNLRYYSWGSQEACTSVYNQPPDKIDYYFVGANSSGVCYAQVRNASDDSLHNILDLELLDTCMPTRDNGAKWESSCSLGVSKDDFFLNRNGWNFKVSYLCNENDQSGGCIGGGTSQMIVQPGSNDKTINLGDPGHVPVAILSNDQFDATQIDISTLELEGATSAGWWADEDDLHPSRIRDVNGDGYDDAMVSFPIGALIVEAGTQTLLLTGQLNDGTWFSLWDTVEIVPEPA